MAALAFDTPLDVDVVEGEVVITAPHGAAAISLTPEAARETAERLDAAAQRAKPGFISARVSPTD